MQTEVILDVGKRGCGKTWWARNFIQNKTRVIVAEAGFGEFGIKCATSFDALIEEVRRGFFRISYTPLHWEWPHLFDLAMSAGKEGGPIWLVLEEASRCPDVRSCEEYDRLLILGRHFNVNLLAISTRPAHLPPDYRSQVTRVVAFRQHEERDLDYLAGIMGDRAFTLPELTGHNLIDWSDKEGQNAGTDESGRTQPPNGVPVAGNGGNPGGRGKGDVPDPAHP